MLAPTKRTLAYLKECGIKPRGFNDYDDHLNLSGSMDMTPAHLVHLSKLEGFVSMHNETPNGHTVLVLKAPAITEIDDMY